MKLVWRVAPKATGRYRSFEKRQWPTAYYDSTEGPWAGQIMPVDDNDWYHPGIAETARLQVRFRSYTNGIPHSKDFRLKKEVVGVKAAKALLEEYLSKNPQHHPVDARNRDA